MTKLLATIFSIILLWSCQKKYIQNNWNVDVAISANAVFTDSNERQTVYFKKNTPMDDPSGSTPIEGASVFVMQNNITYQFSEGPMGSYISDVPFAIEGGNTYTVKYKVEEDVLEETYLNPLPIALSNFNAIQDALLYLLYVDVESPDQQFLLYEIYTLRNTVNEFGEVIDSSWALKLGTKPFNITTAGAGAQSVLFATDDLGFSVVNDQEKVKVRVSPISKRVRDYYLQLNTYYETLATSNLYVSAPLFYLNDFYGITYATQWTSIEGFL